MKNPLNAKRAKRAETVLRAYERWNRNDYEPETAAVDVIADLMHFADREGLDFDELFNRAQRHYLNEVQPDDLEQAAIAAEGR
jgi:hypothetical protein